MLMVTIQMHSITIRICKTKVISIRWHRTHSKALTAFINNQKIIVVAMMVSIEVKAKVKAMKVGSISGMIGVATCTVMVKIAASAVIKVTMSKTSNTCMTSEFITSKISCISYPL